MGDVTPCYKGCCAIPRSPAIHRFEISDWPITLLLALQRSRREMVCRMNQVDVCGHRLESDSA